MIEYPIVDPVLIQMGPVAIHWYGLMYVIAFAGCWWLARYRTRLAHVDLTKEDVSDLLFYVALGVILGGRLGYVLFYAFPELLDDPISLFRIWEGGMSFHGGLLGVIVAIALYARKTQRRFWYMADFVCVPVPIGLAAGRFGNFINGELYGKPTDLPWAMVFPNSDGLLRHPSMLYEMILEGIVLLVILVLFARKPRPLMAISGLFALFYGLFRIAVEFVREPDAHIGYLAFGWVTMGIVLSLPLVILGLVLLTLAYRRGSADQAAA